MSWCPYDPLLRFVRTWPASRSRPLPGAASKVGAEADHLEWRRAVVAGQPAVYGVAGSGPPVLFVHGWGMGAHAYKRPLRRLAGRGRRVYAPALPGFGGTQDLPVAQRTIAGYAAWLDTFLDAMDVNEPTLVIGHSFGGGVATVLAHAYPSRVSYLVLLNSVGGAIWAGDPTAERKLADRPLWDWGVHLVRELYPPVRGLRIINALREDLIPNLLRNPRALWEVGELARRADLSLEMADLRVLGLPVLALWGDRDGVIPQASFDALCDAIGIEGLVLAGSHSWLITNPGAFDEVMANVLDLAGVLDATAGHEDTDRDSRQGGA